MGRGKVYFRSASNANPARQPVIDWCNQAGPRYSGDAAAELGPAESQASPIGRPGARLAAAACPAGPRRRAAAGPDPVRRRRRRGRSAPDARWRSPSCRPGPRPRARPPTAAKRSRRLVSPQITKQTRLTVNQTPQAARQAAGAPRRPDARPDGCRWPRLRESATASGSRYRSMLGRSFSRPSISPTVLAAKARSSRSLNSSGVEPAGRVVLPQQRRGPVPVRVRRPDIRVICHRAPPRAAATRLAADLLRRRGRLPGPQRGEAGRAAVLGCQHPRPVRR